jgi:hypothetical protein
MKNILIITYLALPFFFFSCGNEETENPHKKPDVVVNQPKEIDACSFINQEAVEKIFNIELKDPKKGRSQIGDSQKAAFSECSFESEDESSRIYLSVYIRFTPFEDEYHSTIKSVRSSFKKSDIEVKDVEGIGEAAFWGGNQLHVFRGDNYYIIVTLLGLSEQNEAIEKAKSVVQHVMRNVDSV